MLSSTAGRSSSQVRNRTDDACTFALINISEDNEQRSDLMRKGRHRSKGKFTLDLCFKQAIIKGKLNMGFRIFIHIIG